MTSGWSWFISLFALANVLGALWLLLANGRAVRADVAAKTTHVWDEDLTELNNPLPRWWLWLFLLTIAWGIAYLVFYPGLGRWTGTLGWSSRSQYAAEMKAAAAEQAPRYARFASLSLEQLAEDPDAMGEARSLFANGCAGCHGSDARGAPGFPNLTDDDWLHVHSPEDLVATIGQGRVAVMPGWKSAVGEAGVEELVAYVQSLSGRPDRPELVKAGAQRFAMFCVACHGADARGNPVLGAPDLRDRIWLFGGDAASLRTTIGEGRQNQMPAHEALLGKDRVRLMAAYVLSLHPAGSPPAAAAVPGPGDGAPGGG